MCRLLSCLSGHEWDGSPGECCPVCGGKGSTPGGLGSRVYTQFMDEDSYALAMANKQDIERNSDKVLSGEWAIREKGPKELRPSLPDHLRRYSR